MLGWMKRLLQGDQNSVPDNAKVERDSQGRVSSVKQELSLSGSEARKRAPAPAPSSAFEDKLAASADTFLLTNKRLIETFGVGLESNYSFDQEEGELVLQFPDGRDITADGQIFGTFDPAQRTFLWGWANPSLNPSVTKHVSQIRDSLFAKSEPLLVEGEQSIEFSLITRLMAFAAAQGDFDGVFRAFTNDNTSVFVGFKIKTLHSPDGRALNESEFLGEPFDQADIDAALTLVKRHDAEMFVIDKAYSEANQNVDNGTDIALMRTLLADKDKIYQRDWRRDDDDWEPSSLGWPSDHDADQYGFHFQARNGSGGLLIGKTVAPRSFKQQIYIVERFDDGFKITDQLIEWGTGFIWP